MARDIGLDVEAALIQARSAGAAIVDMARETNSEVIVMAADYHKKLGELDLGRTLQRLLVPSAARSSSASPRTSIS